MTTEFEDGKKEGRRDALIEEHSKSIARINGSLEALVTSVGELAATVRGGNADLAAKIGGLQEDNRAAALAVKVAADTLARETERRRAEAEAQRIERAAALEVPVRTWNLRSSKAGVAALVLVPFGTSAATYLLTH